MKKVMTLALSTMLTTTALAQPPGGYIYSIYDANSAFIGTHADPSTIVHKFHGVPLLVKASLNDGILLNATYLYQTQNCTGQGFLKDDGDLNLFGTAYFDGNNFVIPDQNAMVSAILVKSENYGGTCNFLVPPPPPGVQPLNKVWYVEHDVGIPEVVKVGNPWKAPFKRPVPMFIAE